MSQAIAGKVVVITGASSGLGGAIRTTVISPGAMDTELQSGSSHPESAARLKEFYKMAIPAETVARAVAYAIDQPDGVDLNEIVLRPTLQDF